MMMMPLSLPLLLTMTMTMAMAMAKMTEVVIKPILIRTVIVSKKKQNKKNKESPTYRNENYKCHTYAIAILLLYYTIRR